MQPRASRAVLLALAALAVGCGARTGLRSPVAPRDAGLDASDVVDVQDATDAQDAMDAQDVVDVQDVLDVQDAPSEESACVPVSDRCGAAEVCGNGEDDNCNGAPDEGCPCTPGEVQTCFTGPPGRRHVGACRDGAQVCLMRGTWGPCTGGIGPQPAVCNGLDNACNGCSTLTECPILCPGPGDVRVPDGAPLQPYALRGEDFFVAPARAWQWSVRGGPCDDFSRRPSFDLTGATGRDATFFPRLSGDYTVTLQVTTEGGRTLSCTWVVHVAGSGLRVELCYPENETQDLDLYLHSPRNQMPWYSSDPGTVQARVQSQASCSWANCEATIRGSDGTRADWGYGDTMLLNCVDGPQGDQWRALGHCANPRLDIDNNLQEGTGLPENINVDAPRDGDTFRIMVQNFSGPLAHPLINVYCDGRRVVTYGAPPDALTNFTGDNGNTDIGAMWRVADIQARVDARGHTTCTARGLHPPGSTLGYWVTFSDPSY